MATSLTEASRRRNLDALEVACSEDRCRPCTDGRSGVQQVLRGERAGADADFTEELDGRMLDRRRRPTQAGLFHFLEHPQERVAPLQEDANRVQPAFRSGDPRHRRRRG